MVKRTSCLASNEMFQVRILVGLLNEKLTKRKGYPIGDGTRLETGRAFSMVPCGFNSRSFRWMSRHAV